MSYKKYLPIIWAVVVLMISIFLSGITHAEVMLNERAFVEMQSGKSMVYMNEMIPLSIKLYINKISIRNIQYPEFNHEGFSAAEFDEPLQYQESRGGAVYDVLESKTQLYATKTGEFSLGPARLKADLIIKKPRRKPSSLFDEFFGSYETHPVELKSEKLSLKVLPFPEEGMPEDFKGAVGDFNLYLEVSPVEVRVGDPVALKMIITGIGNFNAVTSPALKGHEGFKTYEPQVKQEDNKKIFEQVLIPTKADAKIPEVTFSFFNPEKAQYQTIVKSRLPLIVLKPEKKEEITILEPSQIAGRVLKKEVPGRDIIYIKESPGKLRKRGSYLYKNILFLLIQILPLLLFVSVLIIKKRREKLSTDIGYARRISAPKKAKKGIHEAQRYLNKNRAREFYDSIFKTLREYLGDRFHLPYGGITVDVVDDVLKNRDIDTEILNRLRNIFKECDMVRYAPPAFTTVSMEKTLKELKEIIAHLQKQDV